MMNPISKKPFNIRTGMVIRGKWHQHDYLIIRELGHGANGSVYLAKGSHGHTALKFSENSTVIAAEVNVLKSLGALTKPNSQMNYPLPQTKAQATLGPCLMDVDDFEYSGRIIPFYVMEYIQGANFLTYVTQGNQIMVERLVVDLLASLEKLHDAGWIFGDLKPDNLIVTKEQRLRFIDVGGTTKEGRAIKEFTDYYDRGYWGLGDRKADAKYDLFAVAMMMIHLHQGKKQLKNMGGLQQLTAIIGQHSSTKRLRPVLLQALKGEFESAKELRTVLIPYQQKLPIIQPTISKPMRQSRRTSKGWYYFEAVFLTMMLMTLYLFLKYL